MQKNILFSILLTVFTLGLYGCSCSQSSKGSHDLAPGLYLSEWTVAEGNSGAKAGISFSVTLQRENSEEVTVSYSVSAIDPEGRTAEEIADFAVVGTDPSDPELDVIGVSSGTITFPADGTSVIQTDIEIVGDTIYEHDEKFQITLSAASAGVNIVQGSIEAVILNDDPVPVITMTTLKTDVAEVFSGVGFAAGISGGALNNTDLTFTLDKASRVDATVLVSGQGIITETTNGAGHRIDYLLLQDANVVYLNQPVVVPAGETSVTVALEVVDDGLAEGTESFQLTMTTAVDTAFDTMDNAHKINFLLADNDGLAKVSALNDTGLTESYAGILSAAQLAATDSKLGLDSVVAPVKTGAGRAGFDYSKYDANGVLTTAQDLTYDADGNEMIPWECVKDNVSGLVWEVKAAGASIRSDAHNFFWYDTNSATNGGDQGRRGQSVCVEEGSLLKQCNTSYYVADVNKMKLCGMTGWRLPTVEELRSLVDYGVAPPGPDTAFVQRAVTYDTEYFARDLQGTKFTWSSTTDAQSPSKAKAIRFNTSSFMEESRSKDSADLATIRLVNDSLLSAQ